MRFPVLHSAFLPLLGLAFLPRAVVHASPPPTDSAVGDYEQWRRDNPRPAGKRLADLNVGEPRTVRLIYFLPNDRPYRAGVVDSMKTAIRNMQTFYAAAMQEHGYENRAFRFEADAQGEPMVHRVDGQHPDSRYLDDTSGVDDEIGQVFDIRENIYFVVIDHGTEFFGLGGQLVRGFGGSWGKNGGFVLIPDQFNFNVAAHELGHAYGLQHDFTDDAYIMSYGEVPQPRLSACHAEFLAVHPYFNPDVEAQAGAPPAIELISPRTYPAGSESVSVQLKVSDSEGLHQVVLLTKGGDGYEGVGQCRGLSGEKESVVEFNYDGVVPSAWILTSLSNPVVHPITVLAVDSDGNTSFYPFVLAETSPHHIATLERHMGSVSSVSFSPDGTTLASGSEDGAVKLWEVGTETNSATFSGHTGPVFSVSFSPDGTTLASGSEDGTVKLWEVGTETNSATFSGHTGPVFSVSFSPDGTTLASGSEDGTVKLWEVGTETNSATFSGHTGPVFSVSFSPDGTTLASGSEDGTVKLWDVATEENSATLDEGYAIGVKSVSFSPDGTILASGSQDGAITLWEVGTETNSATLFEHTRSVSSVSFSPDGTTLASGSEDGTVKLWDVLTREDTATFGHTGLVHSVSFSPNGTIFASATQERTIELWDTSEWTRPRPYRVVKITGDDQQGTPGAALPNPFVVEVRDQYDNPLPDAPVTFTMTAGAGKLSDRFTVENTTTDANGRAERILTLGPDPGTNTVGVSLGGRELVAFHAEGVGTVVSGMEGDYRTWHLPGGATVRLGKGSLGEGERAVAFSPDGKSLAVSSGIGLWLYEVDTSRALALLPSASPLSSVVFSPDGTTLASGSRDGTVKLWDVATRATIASLERHTDGVRSVVFSPDGTVLASGAFDNTVKLWDVATRAIIATLEGHTGGVNSVVFSPDGTVLASGAWDNTVKLWDVATRAIIATLEGHSDLVASVSFSPDGTVLASGSQDGTFKLWEVGRETNSATLFGHTGGISSVSFSPDGTTLASGAWDNTVKLWDVGTRENTATLEGHTLWVRSVSFSPDGTILASGSEDGTVKLWDVATGNAAYPLQEHTGGISSVSFSPDGTTLASGSGNGMVKLWDVATEEISATLFDPWAGSLSSVSFSPDGTILSAGSWGWRILLWDVFTKEKIATLITRGVVRSVSFSPDGTILASGSEDGTVKLWDVATEEISATLEGHTDRVRSVVFSPDGTILASGSEDGTVKLWEVGEETNGTNSASLFGHTKGISSVSFSPDGTILASGAWDNTVKLWDVGTRENTATLEGHTDWIHSVSFSPDGTILASGAWRTVKLWDVATRANTSTLEGHTDGVRSVVFSPDGTTLVSGSEDGTILLWDLQLLEPRPHTLIKVAGDNQQSPAGEALAKPFEVWVRDQHGDLFSGAAVTFTVTAGDGTLSATTATTDANGRVATTLTLGSQPGPNTVEVTLADLDPVVFLAVGQAIPQTLAKVSGDEQEGLAGGELAEPFVVSVLDQNGNPLAGTTVTFAVTAGGGTLSATTDTTGENGLAASTLTLGSNPGGNTVEVTVAGLNPTTFIALGVAIPRTLSRVSGDQQQGAPGTTLPAPLVVSVLDQNGTAFAGASVTFAVTAGEGTLSATTVTTDADGQAASILTLGNLPGANTVTVSVAGLEPVTFTATAEASPDFDGDGETGFSDFFLFADAFGGTDPRFDLDGSGTVDFGDFFLLADHFEDPARGKLLALAREMIGLPDGPQLQQNAPNPFNSQTVISWFQLRPGPARVEVFALTGQRVAVLQQGPQKAGVHRVHWHGRDRRGRPLASGVYLFRLVTDESVQTRKLTLLR